ncbi:MAG TPA: hypothetical protein VFG45_09835 [Candidatus Nitrosocosmicus sp.]|nr:hypothetical protein [Candidatus Nitrosocosmicus sp.]
MFYVTAASAANYYTFLGDIQEGQGTIAEDEADGIGEDKDKQKILKTGYANGGTVPKVEFSKNGTRSQKPYLTFCHKWLAMEEIPDEREIKGVLARSFVFRFLAGDIRYNIKDVQKDENPELFQTLVDLRKTLLVFKILHQNDEFEDLQLNIKNRNAELTKPLLRLFNNTKCQEAIRASLSVLIKEKSEIKNNSTESKMLEALNRLIVENYEEGKEVYQFTNEQIFNALKVAMDGLDNGWDENTYSTFITPDGLHVSKKKITQLLKSKFNAIPDKIFVKGETKRVVRVNKEWLEKLAKQYEVIDEIRILKSKPDIKEEDRHCEPDIMTDLTLVKSASPPFNEVNDASAKLVNAAKNDNVNELTIVNSSNANRLTGNDDLELNEASPGLGQSSDYSADLSDDNNNRIIIEKDEIEINHDANTNDNNIISLDDNNINTDKDKVNDITSKISENRGQAPLESVISVISVRDSNNGDELNLKEFDNVE